MISAVYSKMGERIRRLEELRRVFKSVFPEGVPMPVGSLFPQVLVIADVPFPLQAVLIWSKAFPYYGLDWEKTAQLSWVPEPNSERRRRYIQRLYALLAPAGVLILGADPGVPARSVVRLPNTVFDPSCKMELARGIRKLANMLRA